MRNDTMLRVRMTRKVYRKIEVYAEGKGLTVADAVRCWASDLDGGMTEADLTALIAKLEHRRAALRVPTAAAAAAETDEGRNEP